MSEEREVTISLGNFHKMGATIRIFEEIRKKVDTTLSHHENMVMLDIKWILEGLKKNGEKL